MKKNKMQKFLDKKALVIENIVALKSNLEEIEEISLFDSDESLYNETLSLIDETKAINTDLELSEIIQKAKVIEKKLDSWFAKEGIETTELSWPDV